VYVDNGSAFSSRWLLRACASLGIRLVHSAPYSPEGRGKQERLNRYIRERFLAEATHVGIDSLDELNDRFGAWVDQVANRRTHAETAMTPEARFAAGGRPRAADPVRLAEAFRWSAQRKATRTATVSLDGNHYLVDPSLVGRRVELRFAPEDLSAIDVFVEGRAAGVATPLVVGRHTHAAVPQAARPAPVTTGVDYLGLVAAAHEAETVGPISFVDVPLFDIDDEVAR
jgi:putative transposase